MLRNQRHKVGARGSQTHENGRPIRCWESLAVAPRQKDNVVMRHVLRSKRFWKPHPSLQQRLRQTKTSNRLPMSSQLLESFSLRRGIAEQQGACSLDTGVPAATPAKSVPVVSPEYGCRQTHQGLD